MKSGPTRTDTDMSASGIGRRNVDVVRNHYRPWTDGTDAEIAEISSVWPQIVKIANSSRPESGSERSTRTREAYSNPADASHHDA